MTPHPNQNLTQCTGQCEGCALLTAQAPDPSVPQGWAQAWLWAVVFAWPLVVATAGAVTAGRFWTGQVAQVLGGLAGFAAGLAGAMVAVRWVMRRHSSKHECNLYDNDIR